MQCFEVRGLAQCLQPRVPLLPRVFIDPSFPVEFVDFFHYAIGNHQPTKVGNIFGLQTHPVLGKESSEEEIVGVPTRHYEVIVSSEQVLVRRLLDRFLLTQELEDEHHGCEGYHESLDNRSTRLRVAASTKSTCPGNPRDIILSRRVHWKKSRCALTVQNPMCPRRCRSETGAPRPRTSYRGAGPSCARWKESSEQIARVGSPSPHRTDRRTPLPL